NANFVYEFITQNHGNLLKNAIAFVTLEPCAHIGKTPSCANLLKNLGFKKVVIGVADLNEKASGGGEILAQSGVEVEFCVLKDECGALLKPFLQWQKSGNFSFFKLVFSANGVITGEISNAKSRTFSHYLRSVCDSLIIGGNTVRIDRPKLDTRLITDGKNPDIFIYSRQREFDKTIPLFSVAGRNVQITNDLKTALNSGLVMIEGGQNLLNEIAKSVNLFLFFRSNELKNGQNFRSDFKFKPLFTAKFDSDEYGWYELISHT
ncbi:MAG: riboflavin biosynthesis protein RibD, partial [Campylobacter sp.]|nr:riboflavin biosynthesis protein RibD [Campylobacter sp.]